MNIKNILREIPQYLYERQREYKEGIARAFNLEFFIFASLIFLVMAFISGTNWKFIALAILWLAFNEIKKFKLGRWKYNQRKRYGRYYKSEDSKRQLEKKGM